MLCYDPHNHKTRAFQKVEPIFHFSLVLTKCFSPIQYIWNLSLLLWFEGIGSFFKAKINQILNMATLCLFYQQAPQSSVSLFDLATDMLSFLPSI